MDINTYVLDNEVDIRLTFFVATFVIMASWEWFAPRRKLLISKLQRWSNNLSLVVFNTVILRLLFPAAAVGMATYTSQQGWGLGNFVDFPFAVEVIVSVILLDAIIYFQHVMMHAVPLLWRLHRVHHTDLDFDVTTGSRFHPVEIIFSMLIKFAVIVILGPPVLAVIIFEILLSSAAMFNHSNVKLNKVFDRYLRLLIVTPDMHRVHHSTEMDETNSNYGFNLPWWDRFFGTYRAQPRAGHINMEIGVKEMNNPKQVVRLQKLLLLPFVTDKK